MSRAETVRLRRRPGLITRDLGSSVIVMDHAQQAAHTILDDAADLWRAAAAAEGTPAGTSKGAVALLEKGLLVPVGMTRRAMLTRVGAVGAMAAGATLVESVVLPAVAAHASTSHTYQLGTSEATYIATNTSTDAVWSSPTSGFPFLFYLLSSITVGATSITQGAYTYLNRFDSKSTTQPSGSYTGTWSVGTPGAATVTAPYIGYSPSLFGTPTAVAVTSATQGLGIQFLAQNTNASGQYALSFTVAASSPVSVYVCNATTGALAASHNFATGTNLSYSVNIPTSLMPGQPALGVIIFPNAGAAKGTAVAVVQTVTD